ncbi:MULTISPECIES: YokU family protein [unclassified Bacillus (in: firmicutes)]|uniref:YokU family protein n=1 Tax=unclassified Bacillus (in: firmicutes) TaxID=185979 RepID=UPI000BF0A3DB|nr:MULTISPECIES: YokU family protein [unclassified Bacillus (in: firmicutes)]PEJ59688.1 YokU family protein [Bacillus sp. AFS002410]PEL05888.1 YokU family protein [Bacillus sp. AFS017336]
MTCQWCESANIVESTNTVYWELPDGTKAIEIKETPCVICQNCNITYQTDDTVGAIEEQLYLINTKLIERTLSFQELIQQPRLLKKNYFDFSL